MVVRKNAIGVLDWNKYQNRIDCILCDLSTNCSEQLIGTHRHQSIIESGDYGFSCDYIENCQLNGWLSEPKSKFKCM